MRDIYDSKGREVSRLMSPNCIFITPSRSIPPSPTKKTMHQLASNISELRSRVPHVSQYFAHHTRLASPGMSFFCVTVFESLADVMVIICLWASVEVTVGGFFFPFQMKGRKGRREKFVECQQSRIVMEKIRFAVNQEFFLSLLRCCSKFYRYIERKDDLELERGFLGEKKKLNLMNGWMQFLPFSILLVSQHAFKFSSFILSHQSGRVRIWIYG